jgi:hypothetical protein
MDVGGRATQDAKAEFTRSKSLRASMRYALRAAAVCKLLLQLVSILIGPPTRTNLTTPDRAS